MPIKDQQIMVAHAVCLGPTLPMDLKRNGGLHHIIKGYNNGHFPRGLSGTTIKRKIQSEYETEFEVRKAILATVRLH